MIPKLASQGEKRQPNQLTEEGTISSTSSFTVRLASHLLDKRLSHLFFPLNRVGNCSLETFVVIVDRLYETPHAPSDREALQVHEELSARVDSCEEH